MIYYQPGCWHMGPTAQMPQYIVMPEEMCPDSADLLIEEARRHLGKPYHYGGKGPKVFDCAGFARYVYMKFGFTLPGGSVPQYRLGRNIKDRTKLQKGDLVFFQGRSGKGGVGHTGIVTEVDTNTATSVPTVITPPAYSDAAAAEKPHWGTAPDNDPTSGPQRRARPSVRSSAPPACASIASSTR